MNANHERFLHLLAAQRVDFWLDLARRVDELERLWLQVAGAGRTFRDIRNLLDATQALAGSSATFGIPEVSSRTLALERAIRALLDSDSASREQESLSAVAGAMDELKHVVVAVAH